MATCFTVPVPTHAFDWHFRMGMGQQSIKNFLKKQNNNSDEKNTKNEKEKSERTPIDLTESDVSQKKKRI